MVPLGVVACTSANQINAMIAFALSSSPESSISAASIRIPVALKGIDDLIRAGFESYRDSCFNWLLVATGVVVIGLFFEGPELWKEIGSIIGHWRFERRFHFHLPEERTSNKTKLLASVGWLLIVLGVSGEFVADSFVSKADGYVQQFDEILLADAQRQTELAKIRAGGAYERAANAEKEAAQLRNEAEAEHLARVKIEAAVAFRELTERQKQDIGIAVQPFASVAVASVWFNASSTEAELFADDISEALAAGHIRVQPASGMLEMRENSRFGEPVKRATTGVRIQSTKHEGAQKFAALIVKTLNGLGFDAERQTDPPFDDKPTPQIWINVEPRPKGPQAEYKLQAEREAKARKITNNSTNR